MNNFAKWISTSVVAASVLAFQPAVFAQSEAAQETQAASTQQTNGPDQLARAVLQDVIPQLKAKSKQGNWNQDAAAKFIESEVAPYFNFTRMTAIAVGRPWRQATTAQKQALVTQFHRMLVRTYAKTLLTYKDETVTVFPLPESEAAKNSTIVRAQINRSSGGPVKVDLSVEKKGDTWKVYDVIVGGVSMVMNFRTTFTSEIQKNGIDGLITMLTEKNEKNESVTDNAGKAEK